MEEDAVDAEEEDDEELPVVEKGMLCSRRGGKGDDLNSSIRSVSGTGSMIDALEL